MKEASARGFNDKKIAELLQAVHLEYLIEREGGWDAVADWADVLRYICFILNINFLYRCLRN
jgi:ABC-type uncharacterized transport system fused permease/ATPase subunit